MKRIFLVFFAAFCAVMAFERRKNLIVSLAKEIPGLEVNDPQGAFYLFPKCSSFYGKSDGTTTVNNSTLTATDGMRIRGCG